MLLISGRNVSACCLSLSMLRGTDDLLSSPWISRGIEFSPRQKVIEHGRRQLFLVLGGLEGVGRFGVLNPGSHHFDLGDVSGRFFELCLVQEIFGQLEVLLSAFDFFLRQQQAEKRLLDLEVDIELQELDLGADFFGFPRGDLSPHRPLAGEFQELADAPVRFPGSLEIQRARLQVGIDIQGRLRERQGLALPGLGRLEFLERGKDQRILADRQIEALFKRERPLFRGLGSKNPQKLP